uniref:Uncharacterized protein n=1 Tax=Glossina pallidipes TaxID=7398 RepID=A0A1B0ACJ3_GLOPL
MVFSQPKGSGSNQAGESDTGILPADVIMVWEDLARISKNHQASTVSNESWDKTVNKADASAFAISYASLAVVLKRAVAAPVAGINLTVGHPQLYQYQNWLKTSQKLVSDSWWHKGYGHTEGGDEKIIPGVAPTLGVKVRGLKPMCGSRMLLLTTHSEEGLSVVPNT